MKANRKALAVGLLATGLILASCGDAGESETSESVVFGAAEAVETLKGLQSVALSGIATVSVPEYDAYSYTGVTGIYTDEYFYHGESADSDGTSVGTIAPVIAYENNDGYLATRTLARDNTVGLVNETDDNGSLIAYSDICYQPFINLSESALIWDSDALALSIDIDGVSDGLSLLLDLAVPEELQSLFDTFVVSFDEDGTPTSLTSEASESEDGIDYVYSIDLDFVDAASLEDDLDWGVEPYPDEEGQDGVEEILEVLQNATSYTAYLSEGTYSSYEGYWEIKVVEGVGVYAKNTFTSSPTHKGTLQVGDSYVAFDGLSNSGDAFYQTGELTVGDAVDAYFAGVGEGVTPDYEVAQQFFDVNGGSYELKEEFGTEYFKYLLPVYGLLEDVYSDGFFDIEYDWGSGEVDEYPLTISGSTTNPKITFLYNSGDWPYEYSVTFKDIGSTTIDIAEYGYKEDLDPDVDMGSWDDMFDEETLETWNSYLSGALPDGETVSFKDLVPFYQVSGYDWTLYSSLCTSTSIAYRVQSISGTSYTDVVNGYAAVLLENGFAEVNTTESDSMRTFYNPSTKVGMLLQAASFFAQAQAYVNLGTWLNLLADFDASGYEGLVSLSQIDEAIPYFSNAYGYSLSSAFVQQNGYGGYEYVLPFTSGYSSSHSYTAYVETAAEVAIGSSDLDWSETSDGWSATVDGTTYTVRVASIAGSTAYTYYHSVCIGAYSA